MTELCRIAENVFRTQQSVYTTSGATNVRETFIIKSFSKININKYFLKISNHIYNQDPINNHLIQLIRDIFKTYFNIRIHHFNSSRSQPKERIRSHFTKLVHFRNQ